jgi:hypothetical protein
VNAYLLAVFGIVAWGAVFISLLIAMAISADVERRWNTAWARGWEERNGKSIDELTERLARQTGAWRTAGRLMGVYLWLMIAALAVIALLQASRWIMSPDAFRNAMLFGGALVGLLMLPLKVVCEIGLGLLDGMHRQVRVAMDERIEIIPKSEIFEIPTPQKEKKGKKAPEPAQKAAPPAARQAAQKQAPKQEQKQEPAKKK